MNKFLFMAATLLCFSISGCATKAAPKVTTAPAVAEESPAIAVETISQPAPAIAAVESAEIVERQPTSLGEADVAIEPVYFLYDSFLLSETATAALTDVSQIFLQNPEIKAILAGHCDDRGSEMYNIALGEKRALAVKKYLTTLGVEADRLEVVSYGEEKPAAIGVDEKARALNRRVEFL